MSREAFLDIGPGEARAVITLNGQPERLLISRDTDIACQRLGAVMTARVARVERGLATAFLQLPEGRDAVLPIKPDQVLAEGVSVEIEIAAEARGEKGAVAKIRGAAMGPPRLIEPGASLEQQVAALIGKVDIDTGLEARIVADEAEEAAIATVHALPGGGSISIEPTRALIAVDVDVGGRGGADSNRALRTTNLTAIAETARLLRLKGLSGLVVIDLAGKGHDGAAMTDAARRAFAPDGPTVSIGPISRFGLFELALPWASTPISERLLDRSGQPSPQTMSFRVLRALEREGRASPGARLLAETAPEVAAAARVFEPRLAERLGARFVIRAEPALPRATYQIKSL